MTIKEKLQPFKVILILCAGRSGSNLLCSMMRSIPGNAAYFEVFADHGIEGLQHLPHCRANMAALLGLAADDATDDAFLAARTADPVGFFYALCAASQSVGHTSLSCKIFPDHLTPANLEALLRFPNLSVLFLTRSRIERRISAVKGDILRSFVGVDTTDLRPTLPLALFLQDAFDTDRLLEGLYQQVRSNGLKHGLLSYDADLDIAPDLRFDRLASVLCDLGINVDFSAAVTEGWIVKQDRAGQWTDKIVNGFEIAAALAGLGLADYARDAPLLGLQCDRAPVPAKVAPPRNEQLLECYGNNRVLSSDPVITFSAIEYTRSFLAEWMIGPEPAFGSREGMHFLKPTWTMEQPNLSAFASTLRQAERCNPGHVFVVMHVSEIEAQRYRDLGVRTILGNPNLFADETTLPCDADALADVPLTDTIYVARLLPWKQHGLASQLNAPLFVYGEPDTPEAVEQMALIRQSCPTARFVNHDLGHGTYQYLKRPDLVRAMSCARVSLALSPVEGVMRATTEALLTGLPVVSIPSIGGRETFFTSDTALIVEPTPEAVRMGVDQMLARRLTRAEVRKATLAKIHDARHHFTDAANRMVQSHLGPLAPVVRVEPLLDFIVRYDKLGVMIGQIR